MTDIDQYALQRSLFGGTNTEIHNKAYREELHAREKDHIPNPNVNPGQYAPKGGRNPLLKVVQHANGWTASTMLPGGKEFRVEGNSHQEAVSNAIRAGEKLGHVFDPPKAEPEIGGLFHGGHFDEKQHPREQVNAGTKHAGQFAPKHQPEPAADAPFVLQRPKKNRAVAKFDNNANTKQGGLFDAGKKGELPGQSLLFNSDAGDLHNPKTMENKVASSESKSQPEFNHDQHIKIAADSIGSLRKQDVYRLLEFAPKEHRRSVADHIGKHRPEFIDEINESLDDLGEQSVKYSRRVYEQFEQETERYLRDYTLYDVDRYGIGGKLMRTILAFMAMHAMSSMISKKPQGGAPKQPAQASTPSNLDFEKLHPREVVAGGNHKPGQFAKKPAGQSSGASPSAPKESVLSSTLHHDPKQIEREQQAADMKNHLAGVKSLQPHFKKKAADQARADKATARDAAKAQREAEKKAADQARADKAAERDAAKAQREAEKKAALEEKNNPDWLKKAQEAMARQAAKPRTGAFADDAPPVPHSPQQPAEPAKPIQAPQDRHTAKVAEIWHGKPDAPEQTGKKWWHSNEQNNTPSVESFTNEVLQHHAGQSESSPRNYPDNLNKPPEEQTNYAPPERSIHDVMRNPAWEKQKAEEQEPYSPGDRSIHDIMRNPAWEKQKAKEASDKLTHFDPKEFESKTDDEEIGNKEYDRPMPTEDEFSTPENLERMKQWRAARPENESDRPAWRKQKPETFESAMKKWKRNKSRVALQNKKAIHEGNPDDNIASVASEYEIDHEPFSQYVNQMQAYEQDQWKQREAVKTAIRKAWGVHGGTLRDMENKGLDHSSLESTDNLKGNLTDAQIHEHLGSDESSWSQNAWAMLREDAPPKPGAHDREWLDRHAHEFLRMQANQHEDPAEYPEPEDGMPFSRRSLALSADRYFRELRKHDNQKCPQNWTILDQWM